MSYLLKNKNNITKKIALINKLGANIVNKIGKQKINANNIFFNGLENKSNKLFLYIFFIVKL